MVEENETISYNNEISEKPINFFEDIVKSLSILQYKDHSANTDDFDDKEKNKNHPSIQLIKRHYEDKNNSFCFSNRIKCLHTEIEKE